MKTKARSGETLYSPYRPLEAGELADYAGVPLYTFTVPPPLAAIFVLL